VIDSVEEVVFVGAAVFVLAVLSVVDLRERRIPNVIVLPATGAALVWTLGAGAAGGEWDMPVRALACGAAFFCLLFVLAVVSSGMGFGDVKLGAFIGVVTGRFGSGVTVFAALTGVLVGGLVAAAVLVIGRRGRKQWVPYGPSMSVGAVAALLAGERAVRSWFGL
jgi:leader peptidase (prepilin peptidase)/N-methyltransferase